MKVTVVLEDPQGKHVAKAEVDFKLVDDVGVIKFEDKFYTYVPQTRIHLAPKFREVRMKYWNNISK
jgi:hypothetical protein